MTEKEFNCFKCGKCCEILSRFIPSLKDELDENNVCKHYDKSTKLCNIYNNRPLECNVKEYYIANLKDKVPIDDYFKLNLDCCKLLNKDNITLEDLIKSWLESDLARI